MTDAEFQAAFDQNKDAVYRFAWRMSGSAAAAEDITQDVFARNQNFTMFKQAGVHFRNEVESGPGGRQIQIEDPDGNPVELFEPAS